MITKESIIRAAEDNPVLGKTERYGATHVYARITDPERYAEAELRDLAHPSRAIRRPVVERLRILGLEMVSSDQRALDT
jgi:hypothetical protein